MGGWDLLPLYIAFWRERSTVVDESRFLSNPLFTTEVDGLLAFSGIHAEV